MTSKPINEVVRGSWIRPTLPSHWWLQGFLIGALLTGALAYAYILVVYA